MPETDQRARRTPAPAGQRGEATRLALLRAGEDLFANRGTEGPSLREITATAGVANKSALHYHFGSRDGLVRAILAHHGEVLRRRRAMALEQIIIDSATADPHRLCDLVVRPYALFLRDGTGEWAYLVIAAEVLADPLRVYEDLPDTFNDPLLPTVVQMLLDALDLPPELAAERVLVGVSQVIAAIAVRARRQLAHDRQAPPPRRLTTHHDLFVANLVDMLAGALTAPTTAATLGALAPAPRPPEGSG